ncbi:hypothetical protein B0H17DRAFT_1074583, partial [Mycena rosella]
PRTLSFAAFSCFTCRLHAVNTRPCPFSGRVSCCGFVASVWIAIDLPWFTPSFTHSHGGAGGGTSAGPCRCAPRHYS